MDNEQNSGRTCVIIIDEIVHKVNTAFRFDKNSILCIIKGYHLYYYLRKIYVCWIPKMFTTEQKTNPILCSLDILQHQNCKGPEFLPMIGANGETKNLSRFLQNEIDVICILRLKRRYFFQIYRWQYCYYRKFIM